MSLILASSSPRRRELLSYLDIPFTVASADIDETILEEEIPTNYIRRMVQEKAMAVYVQMHTMNITNKNDKASGVKEAKLALILTADTIGVLPNGRDVLVKPVDKADAFAMWRGMSGCEHQVWTAVQTTLVNLQHTSESSEGSALSQCNEKQVIWKKQILETTKVEFITLTEADMQRYWQTGEPVDKAGGYAIQGKAAAWVSRIEGSYTNVVGLPLAQTKALIDEGLKLLSSTYDSQLCG